MIILADVSYQMLAPIPQLTTSGSATNTSLAAYLPDLVRLAIAVASGLAVLRIIIGGIKYMLSETFSGKSDARETIEGAIFGLLLAMSAWVILSTVNPSLVQFNLGLTPVGQGGTLQTCFGPSCPTIAAPPAVKPDDTAVAPGT